MATQQPGDAVNAAARALGTSPTGGGPGTPGNQSPAPQSGQAPSNLRKALNVAGNALYAVGNATNKAMDGLYFISQLVAGESPSGQVRPQGYQGRSGTGQPTEEEKGHYAPEAAPASPLAYGHPHGQGWAHGPQNAHRSGPGIGGP